MNCGQPACYHVAAHTHLIQRIRRDEQRAPPLHLYHLGSSQRTVSQPAGGLPRAGVIALATTTPILPYKHGLVYRSSAPASQNSSMTLPPPQQPACAHLRSVRGVDQHHLIPNHLPLLRRELPPQCIPPGRAFPVTHPPHPVRDTSTSS